MNLRTFLLKSFAGKSFRMTERKLRRKTVTVTFSGDDDVVQHIIDVNDTKTGKKKSKSRRQSYPRRDKDEVENDSEEENIPLGKSTALEEETDVFGGDVFKFRTPKKSGQMAAMATEARTPKSILKTPGKGENSSKSVNFTPSKETRDELRTPTGKRHSLRERKSVSTTPYRLHKRQSAEDSDTDDSGGTSEDDSDSGEDKPSSKQSTPSRKIRRKTEELDIQSSNVEDYFDIHSSGTGPTSDATLAKLDMPRMDHETLNKLLSSMPSHHLKECSEMYKEHQDLFRHWMYQMSNGFNILLYGLGSKRSLMEDFRNTHIKGFSHLVVNGYFPSLTIKHILNSITDDLLECTGTYKSPLDHAEFIKTEVENSESDIFLIIHNIDGSMLRNEKSQNILSLLSQISGIHVVASIDHINAPLIWDQTKFSRFNWLWHDVTTFTAYQEETSYENSLLVQQTGALALSSLTHVMKSLTPNAKGIFLLLARYQLENTDNSNYIGMSLHDLYQRCRESFLVNSDLTLQAQLTEFRDHKMIRSKKSFEGVEHLTIPIDTNTLSEFVEQHSDS